MDLPLSGFDHVTIAVRDLSAATRTYAALLGNPPIWLGEQVGLGSESALFALENALLELVAPRAGADEGEGLRQRLEARGEGLIALALATSDVDACGAALRARGARVTSPQMGTARAADGSERSYRSLELSTRTTRGVPLLIVERPETRELRAAAQARPDAVHALDHVVIRTSSPEAALALYGEQLGVRLALDRELGATRMLFFRIGGVTLEVVQDASLGEQDALWGLAYRVRSIEAAHARLVQADFALSEPRAGRKPGTQVLTVREPTCGVPTLVLFDAARA